MTSVLKRGLVAGAVGTTVLNAVTYLDMALRGRPSSQVPAETVEAVLESVGLQMPGSGRQRQNRLTALGALSGTGAGLAVGLVGSAARAGGMRVSGPTGALALGAAAMLATDGPATALGVVDPSSWTVQDWIADAVPHLAFGAATVVAIRALDEPDLPVRRASFGLLVRSALLGLASGSRSSLGLAAVTLTSSTTGRPAKGLAVLAVGAELIADKSSGTPTRTSAQGLPARYASAVGGASALAGRERSNTALPVLAAALGATAGSFGGLAWRRWSGQRMDDGQAALIEDGVACLLAALAVRSRS